MLTPMRSSLSLIPGFAATPLPCPPNGAMPPWGGPAEA